MEDQIPQSFKVQWLNTTLKFLKNDDQLVMEYPEMAVTHMEYLHNLIWKRKNDVGLGFKSLYAPVWEAMAIFSLKYRFKVLVNKSVDGEKGHLVIEKIPKKTNSNKMESFFDNSQGKDNNDSEETDPESPGSTKKCPNIQCKVKKSLTKSEKYLVEKRKVIDSISPAFLRRTLQSILNFINNEIEASIVFSDLAPIESTFLENFLGIYNRRKAFDCVFTPDCNELLSKIYESFKDFEQNCKLEIGAAKYDYHTKKREVVYLKVPRYKQISNKQFPENQTVSTDNRSKEASNLEGKIINNENKAIAPKVHVKSLNNVVGKDKKKEENKKKENPVDDIAVSFTKEPVERSSTSVSKDKALIKNQQIANNELMTNRCMTKLKGCNPRQAKLLEALTTPMKSDKAIRMMYLMGWDGGALGTRGEGIVEPIIPELYLPSRAGFGHEGEIPKSKKRNPNIDNRVRLLEEIINLLQSDISVSVIAYETAIVTKGRKSFKNIVDAINIRTLLELTSNEKSLMQKIKRMIGLMPKMFLTIEFSEDFREVTITKLFNKVKGGLKDSKSKQEDCEETSLDDIVTDACMKNEPLLLRQFKKHVCTRILEFLKSAADKEVVRVKQVLGRKSMAYVEYVCACVNERKRIPYNMSERVVSEIMDNIGDCYLDVEFDVNERSFSLYKLNYENQYISQALIQDNEQNHNDEILKNSMKGTNHEKHTKENIDIIKSNIENEIEKDIKNECIEDTIICKSSTERETTEFLSSTKADLNLKADGSNDLQRNIEDSIQDDRNIEKEQTAEIKDYFVPKNKLFNKEINFKDTNTSKLEYEEIDFKKIDAVFVKEIILRLTSPKNDENCDLNIDKYCQEIHTGYDDELHLKEGSRSMAVQNSYGVLESTRKICVVDKSKNGRQWFNRSELFLTSNTLMETENSTINKVVYNKIDNIINSGSGRSNIHKDHFKEEEVKRKERKIDNNETEKLKTDSLMKNIDLNNNKNYVYNVRENKVQIKDEKENPITVSHEKLLENSHNADNDVFVGTVACAEKTFNEKVDKVLKNPNSEVGETFSQNTINYQDIISKNSTITTNNLCVSNIENVNIQTKEDSIVRDQEEYTNKNTLELEKFSEKENNTQDKDNCNKETNVTGLVDYNSEELLHCIKSNNDKISGEMIAENITVTKFSNHLVYENCTKLNHYEDSNNYHALSHNSNSEDGRCHDIVVIKFVSNQSSKMLKDLIQNNLETETDFLPFLKCHSGFDSGIIYSCHNERTRAWLENIFGERVINYRKKDVHHKLIITIANFSHDKQKILKFLNIYNSDLKTNDWTFDSNYQDSCENNFTFMVAVDDTSFKYVCDHSFSLWAGFDRAYFIIGY